jgi:hypothetical protein
MFYCWEEAQGGSQSNGEFVILFSMFELPYKHQSKQTKLYIFTHVQSPEEKICYFGK